VDGRLARPHSRLADRRAYEAADGSVTVGGLINGIAQGAGSIWVSDAEDGMVLRVDPKENAIVSKIPVVGSPSGLAYGYGRIWVSVD